MLAPTRNALLISTEVVLTPEIETMVNMSTGKSAARRRGQTLMTFSLKDVKLLKPIPRTKPLLRTLVYYRIITNHIHPFNVNIVTVTGRTVGLFRKVILILDQLIILQALLSSNIRFSHTGKVESPVMIKVKVNIKENVVSAFSIKAQLTPKIFWTIIHRNMMFMVISKPVKHHKNGEEVHWVAIIAQTTKDVIQMEIVDDTNAMVLMKSYSKTEFNKDNA